MNPEDLIAALNDPNSPLREKLLNNLSMSPLDPAAAFQQLTSQTQQTEMGGIPAGAPQGGLPQDFAAMLYPNTYGDMPKPTANIMPGETGGIPDAAGQNDIAKTLSGAAGAFGQDNSQRVQYPGAPAVHGNRWSSFQAGQLQTPAMARPKTLAELLAGR